MKSKSINLLFSLLLMAAVSLIIPDVSRTAMWVGGQIGVDIVADGDIKYNIEKRTDRLKDV